MAILIADDFKGYGTNPALMLNGLWAAMPDNTAAQLVEDPDPNETGIVFRLTGTFGTARRVFTKGSLTSVGFAFRLWMANLPSRLGPLVACLSTDLTYRAGLWVQPTGVIAVTNNRPGGGAPTIVGQTSVPVLVANAYNHIEVRFDMGTPASGDCEVRVNGVTVLFLQNVDLGANSVQQFILSCGEGAFDAYFKDFVVWDGSGTRNSNFLGTVSVIGLTTNADVSMPWTPSTGTTGWNLLDNSPPLDNTDYITAGSPPPAAAVFENTDLPLNVSSVRGLVTQVRARKGDGGDGNIQAGLISNGVEIDGTDRPITTAFTYYEDVFETDPNTGNAWTPASASAARLSLKRTV